MKSSCQTEGGGSTYLTVSLEKMSHFHCSSQLLPITLFLVTEQKKWQRALLWDLPIISAKTNQKSTTQRRKRYIYIKSDASMYKHAEWNKVVGGGGAKVWVFDRWSKRRKINIAADANGCNSTQVDSHLSTVHPKSCRRKTVRDYKKPLAALNVKRTAELFERSTVRDIF